MVQTHPALACGPARQAPKTIRTAQGCNASTAKSDGRGPTAVGIAMILRNRDHLSTMRALKPGVVYLAIPVILKPGGGCVPTAAMRDAFDNPRAPWFKRTY